MAPRDTNGPEPPSEALSRLLDELDRLEDLLEEMDELGVTTRAEVEARIAALESQVADVLPDEG